MASIPKGTLLRILRNDSPDPDQYVLLHITPSGSTQPLNLQLHATDGERAFGMKLKQSKINDLRAKSYDGSVEELERIFSSLLLKTSISDPHLLPRGVELAASVDDSSVTLTIRQDVGGIKQRIAALKIPEAEVEIQIFEWAVESCGVLDSTSIQLQDLQSRVLLQEEEIEKLATQLRSLVALKKEHEETLLVKFSELLNSKKRKIRELNRALETATEKAGETASPRQEEEVQGTNEPEPTLAAVGPSRTRATSTKAVPKTVVKAPTRKRKPVAPPSDSESDGFVKMDVDPKGKSGAASTENDETEDSEDGGGGVKSGDYLRQNELGQSDRSATEDEDELPPVRKPSGAFTLRPPEKRTPEPEAQTQAGGTDMDAEEDSDPKPAARGRGRVSRARGSRGRGRGKETVSPPSPSPPPVPARGRGRGRMATRSKPPAKEQSPSPPPPEHVGDTGEDTDDDDEL